VNGDIRPDEFDLPLFLHVGGAMLLVGTLVLSAAALVMANRTTADRGVLARFGFRVLLLGAIPSYVLMRVGAQWIVSKEGLEDAELSWVDIGFITSDLGLLVLIAGTVVAGLAVRRLRRGGAGASRAAPILAFLLVAIYIVAIWAMAAKPT
jgi:hypothetical protein